MFTPMSRTGRHTCHQEAQPLRSPLSSSTQAWVFSVSNESSPKAVQSQCLTWLQNLTLPQLGQGLSSASLELVGMGGLEVQGVLPNPNRMKDNLTSGVAFQAGESPTFQDPKTPRVSVGDHAASGTRLQTVQSALVTSVVVFMCFPKMKCPLKV